MAQGSHPAKASASAKQQPDSPVVVDLCSSPLPPAKLATASGPDQKGGMLAAAATVASDTTDQVEMMDISQSPVKRTGASLGSGAAASCQSHVQGGKAPMLGLTMDAAMSGSADPYWQRLSDLIVHGGIASEHADEMRQVFAEEHQDKWGGRVPAYLLSGTCRYMTSNFCRIWVVCAKGHQTGYTVCWQVLKGSAKLRC